MTKTPKRVVIRIDIDAAKALQAVRTDAFSNITGENGFHLTRAFMEIDDSVKRFSKGDAP
jgi:hypothetical protein